MLPIEPTLLVSLGNGNIYLQTGTANKIFPEAKAPTGNPQSVLNVTQNFSCAILLAFSNCRVGGVRTRDPGSL